MMDDWIVEVIELVTTIGMGALLGFVVVIGFMWWRGD